MRATYFYCAGCRTVHQKPLCGADEVFFAAPAIHGDECDFVQENGTREPIHFRSKQAHREWLDGADLRLREKFTPLPGTDKDPAGVMNPNGYVDQVTLANRKALVLRALSRPRPGPDQAPETVVDLPTDWTVKDAGMATVRR